MTDDEKALVVSPLFITLQRCSRPIAVAPCTGLFMRCDIFTEIFSIYRDITTRQTTPHPRCFGPIGRITEEHFDQRGS
jgi:hypothetical protein